MRLRRILACLFFSVAATPAPAQGITTSAAPQNVSVTIYRDPNRPASQGMNLGWLNGYALISETRRILVPAGDAEIRFEGVAGGILPESAIVTGLPEGVVEKNQDAWLLSPASLVDRSLGRRVHIRRTSLATGAVTEHEAVIRSGPAGAVVLQTAEGFEALRCTGLSETIVYPEVPQGLSAKPTLSVRTRSSRAVEATVTLSYLASGFDWQANYVAAVDRAGTRLDLFAWVTLANGDETSFVGANTQAVAGHLNREDSRRDRPPAREGLQLRCWPQQRTSDIPEEIGLPEGVPAPAPPPPMEAADSAIVVTGSRIRTNMAQQEELGDLKLYRIPDPVTVAANSQKQVAMLDKPKVRIRSIYRQRFTLDEQGHRGALRVITTKNRTGEGLGLPLPAGRVVLFASGYDRPVLIGEGYIDDSAVGEDVEVEIAEASGVITRQRELRRDAKTGATEWEIVVTNDRPTPVTFEAEIGSSSIKAASKARLSTRDGRMLWTTRVPANGEARLRYKSSSPD
ncbi:MAG TPA: hypothetical protein VF727_05800 [Allosphingosinicella sp.]